MKKIMVLVLLSLLIFFVSFKPASFGDLAISSPQGEYLYKKHCSGCHREPTRLKRVANLTYSMRNPPAAMPQFDKNKISDIDAQAIADYIHFDAAVHAVSKTSDVLNAPSTVAQRRIQ